MDKIETFELMPIDKVEKGLRAIRDFQNTVKELMVPGLDYGIIPGTQKPTMLKPGAEKLAKLMGLADTYETLSESEDWMKPFFAYKIKCKLSFIGNGKVVSEGIGECNSLEARYRYRWVYEKDIPLGINKDNLVEKEFYSKKGGKFYKYRIDNDDICSQVNCVTPETRILTKDLRWIPAGKITTGTPIIGVEDKPSSKYKRTLLNAIATVYGTKQDTIYEVKLTDGRKVRCNGEHKWLVKKVGLKGTEWISTESIYAETKERKGRPRQWSIMSLCKPWEEENTRESGYIAGLFDADGCLSISGQPNKQIVSCFAQQDNVVLKILSALLKVRFFSFGKISIRSAKLVAVSKSKKPVHDLRIKGGLVENMRFLGSIRPPRLLQKWCKLVDLSGRRFEGRGISNGRGVNIDKIESIGQGDIVLLGSSSGTYIAEGLVAHNTLLKMAKKRALVDAALSAGRLSAIFTQDIEDFREEEENSHIEQKRAKQEPPQPQQPTDDILLNKAAQYFDVLKKYGLEGEYYTLLGEYGDVPLAQLKDTDKANFVTKLAKVVREKVKE